MSSRSDILKYEIKYEHGHYVAYRNGMFFGSYDTITEAAKDIDSEMASRHENE